jgi:hypothetical protein
MRSRIIGRGQPSGRIDRVQANEQGFPGFVSDERRDMTHPDHLQQYVLKLLVFLGLLIGIEDARPLGREPPEDLVQLRLRTYSNRWGHFSYEVVRERCHGFGDQGRWLAVVG